MAEHASFVEQERLVVHTRPVIDMDDERFFQFCQLNRDLQIERTAEGDIIIMAPEGGSSGRGSSALTLTFGNWAHRMGAAALSLFDCRGVQTERHLFACFSIHSPDYQ